jgi:hypothetical protein
VNDRRSLHLTKQGPAFPLALFYPYAEDQLLRVRLPESLSPSLLRKPPVP